MARKQKYDYFEEFVRISEYAVQYAEEMVRFIEEHYEKCQQGDHFSSATAMEEYKNQHVIEEKSDDVLHRITAKLADEFVTPIEREDILLLAEELDSVVDALDDVLQRMYMYNVSSISAEIVGMARIAQKSVGTVNKVCEKFTHYRKSGSIRDYIVAVNDAEDEGDVRYIHSMHDIYAAAGQSGDFREVLNAFAMAGVLGALEKCCDACEAASDTVLTVIMKNA